MAKKEGRVAPSRRDHLLLRLNNLNVHRAAGLRLWAEGRDWLIVYYLPPYAPDLNPVEGIRSLLRRGRLSNGARGCASQPTPPDRRSPTNVSKRER
ncbi:transposase [Streptomyces inhibens]|uniref:transposase n=1 Tax=Streptomyces inhibens TaxID=2293571 RepID=UPI0037B15839